MAGWQHGPSARFGRHVGARGQGRRKGDIVACSSTAMKRIIALTQLRSTTGLECYVGFDGSDLCRDLIPWEMVDILPGSGTTDEVSAPTLQ